MYVGHRTALTCKSPASCIMQFNTDPSCRIEVRTCRSVIRLQIDFARRSPLSGQRGYTMISAQIYNGDVLHIPGPLKCKSSCQRYKHSQPWDAALVHVEQSVGATGFFSHRCSPQKLGVEGLSLLIAYDRSSIHSRPTFQPFLYVRTNILFPSIYQLRVHYSLLDKPYLLYVHMVPSHYRNVARSHVYKRGSSGRPTIRRRAPPFRGRPCYTAAPAPLPRGSAGGASQRRCAASHPLPAVQSRAARPRLAASPPTSNLQERV